MLQSFSHLIIFFLLYSAIGWVCETLYCSVPAGNFVKRGFLKGPYCPIYGVGALLIYLLAQPVESQPLLVFLVSMVAATLLEYFTSWLLERIFQIRWWDYSGKKFQLNGRIRLKNSLLFGALGLVVTYLLQPGLEHLVNWIPAIRLRVLANGLSALFLLDLLSTIARLTGFTQRLQQIQVDLQEMRGYREKSGWFDGKDLEGSLRRLKERGQAELEDRTWIARLESLLEKRKAAIPQLSAYKSARTKTLGEAWETVQDELRRRGAERPSFSLRSEAKQLGAKTAAAGKATAKTVWGNLSYYQLFWVFLLAGILGYLVETLYCLLTTGGIESRQGLLYGPFNQVYGFGAVLMVVVLAPLAQKNDRWVFAGGAVLGGLFEIFCSWVQEKAFGSVSWQYEDHPFSLAGGRTNLLFAFFWGVLGLWFIKGLYPRLLSFIRRIPRRHGRTLTALLSLLLIGNMVLSAAAVLRWSGRMDGNPGESAVGSWLDRHYPDEFMETVYPNMHWPESEAPAA